MQAKISLSNLPMASKIIYQARSILKRFGESTKDYYNSCEEVYVQNSNLRIAPPVAEGENNWYNDDLDLPDSKPEASVNEDFVIVPNPTNGDITISGKHLELTTSSIEVYNALGQQEKVPYFYIGTGIKANLASLPNGVYFIRVLGAKGVLGQTSLVKQ